MKSNNYMAAETNDTYQVTPDARSVFSASQEAKSNVVNQTPADQPKKLEISQIKSVSKNKK